MGDRRIVLLEFPEGFGADLALYTHWGGSEAEDKVTAIVESKSFRSRLGDETYAARIFVDQFTKDARDEETGYGVFPVLKGADPMRFAENSYSGIITVDLRTGDVDGFE